MKLSTGTLLRILRGLIGVTFIVLSFVYESWIGLPGVLLLLSAISGKCGFGNASCEIKPDSHSENNKKTISSGRLTDFIPKV